YQRAVSALRHARVLRVESLDVTPPPEPERYFQPARFEDRIAEGEALEATLKLLGPQDTACVLLSIVHGFTAPEIAAILEISPVAAKKRLTRAKQRLRDVYFECQHQSPELGERRPRE
ncbi:MAG TPA: sigma-70 family RNA polymerase sigma factor, partial [Ktedonobacterales bacterium]